MGEYPNSGCFNSGNYNAGDFNAGNRNVGNYNTGSFNTGDCNVGDHNSGDYNTGNFNDGDHNTGNCNFGNSNTGGYNVGDYNTGDLNTGSYSAGCFNTLINQTITMFNKPSDWTMEDWVGSKARVIILSMFWNEEEKQVQWDNLSEEDKAIVMSLPNFDAEIFEECTGIRVDVPDKSCE